MQNIKNYNIFKYTFFLKSIFEDIDLRLGGMIGIGIHPLNWDKTYALQILNDYQDISYIGDCYHEDGNDYPLLNHPRVKGYNVDSQEDTKEIIKQINIHRPTR